MGGGTGIARLFGFVGTGGRPPANDVGGGAKVLLFCRNSAFCGGRGARFGPRYDRIRARSCNMSRYTYDHLEEAWTVVAQLEGLWRPIRYRYRSSARLVGVCYLLEAHPESSVDHSRNADRFYRRMAVRCPLLVGCKGNDG